MGERLKVKSAALMLGIGLMLAGFMGLVWTTGRFATLLGPTIGWTIGWYLCSFAGFAVLLVAAERQKLSWGMLWGAAILFRVLMLTTTPTLSDDVYRYLWDGHVATNYLSPYLAPIDSPTLDFIDIPIRELANNRWMASPYMPAAQWVFHATVRWLATTPLAMQVVMVAFDLATALILRAVLRHLGIPTQRLLLYLLNPLVIVEIAHGAHVDAVMLFFVAAALWATLKFDRRPDAPIHQWLAAPGLMALATLTKIVPVLLLPVLYWRWSWRQRIAYGVMVVGALLPAGLQAGWGLTGPLDGKGLFGALRIYSDEWKFNAGLFHYIENWLLAGGVAEPIEWAKSIGAVVTLLTLLFVWLRSYPFKSELRQIRWMIVPFMAYLLITPTVFPWYGLLIMVWLPFWGPVEGETGRCWTYPLPWLYLAAAFIFSYLYYLFPTDPKAFIWVRPLQWIPTFLLLTLPAVFRWRQELWNR